MLVTGMFRWLIGSVELEAVGGFPERFVSLMGGEGLSAQSLYPTEIGLRAAVRPGIYRRLRPIARKSGMRIRIVGKKGFPFLVQRYHRRTGILIGMIALSAMLMFLQLFVWRIEINGCETLDPQLVMEKLDDLGIQTGTFVPSIDAWHSERQMLLQMPQLSWIAINILGSTIEVNVRERVMPPVTIDRNTAANVISSGVGVIREIEVYHGQPLVQVGEAVWEGRLLVAGIYESNLHTIVSYARAKVIAQVEDSLTVTIPLQQTLERATGKTVKRYHLQLGDTALTLNPWTKLPQNAWISRQTVLDRWKLPDWFWLPKLVVDVYEQWEPVQITYTVQQAKEEAIEQLERQEQSYFGEAGYLERSLNGKVENGAYHLTAQYQCLRDVAQTQEVLLDQPQ